MRAATARRVLNLWPPFLFTGIAVTRISPDFRELDVRLADRLLNRNLERAHYGGSLFSMTDPFYALLLRHELGRGYVIWAKRASIDFVRPGRGTVTAAFRLTPEIVAVVRAATAGGDKLLQDFKITVVDGGGRTVAAVEQTLYIRKRRPR